MRASVISSFVLAGFYSALSVSHAGQLLEPENKLADDVLQLTLEDILSQQAQSLVTLTASPLKLAPASITAISDQDIERLGTRRLNEIVEIMSPSTVVLRHHAKNDHIGIRGIVGDQEDKNLLLVNGRLLNLRLQRVTRFALPSSGIY